MQRKGQKKKQRFLYLGGTPYSIPSWYAPRWSHPFYTKELGGSFPRGGNQRACLRLRACTRLCVFVRDAGQQRVLCPSRLLQQEPCLAHPLTACLKQLLSHAVSHSAALACFKWHSVVLGFGWSEEQSGPLCHLSSQCAVSGLGQTEYKVPVRWWNRHFTTTTGGGEEKKNVECCF